MQERKAVSRPTAAAGNVSVVCQDAGTARAIGAFFAHHGLGLSLLPAGRDAADGSVAEVVERCGEEEDAGVIVVQVDDLADSRDFLDRVAPVAATRPVLALVGGVPAPGGRAVRRGSEEDRLARVLLDKAGVLRLSGLSELCHAALALATQPLPRGDRIELVCGVGSLPAVLEDEGVDGAVVCLTAPELGDGVVEAAALAAGAGKPLLAAALPPPDEQPEWREAATPLREAGVPVYRFPDEAVGALRHLDRYRRLRDRPREPVPELDADRQAATALLGRVDPDEDGCLAAEDTRALLGCYGLPLAEDGQECAPGLEVVVRGAAAPGLGATVSFGLGGVHGEVVGDVAVGLAPLCRPEAAELLDGIAASALLAGGPGRPGVHRGALIDVLLRTSALLAAHPDVVELALEPVRAYPEGHRLRVVEAWVRVAQRAADG